MLFKKPYGREYIYYSLSVSDHYKVFILFFTLSKLRRRKKKSHYSYLGVTEIEGVAGTFTEIQFLPDFFFAFSFLCKCFYTLTICFSFRAGIIEGFLS